MFISEVLNEKGKRRYLSTWHTDGHTIITDWTNCRIVGINKRVDWKRSVKKTIRIEYDTKVDTFKIEEYIQRPSKTAHDAKVRIKSVSTKKEYTLWTRDLKQGDCGKLFK